MGEDEGEEVELIGGNNDEDDGENADDGENVDDVDDVCNWGNRRWKNGR